MNRNQLAPHGVTLDAHTGKTVNEPAPRQPVIRRHPLAALWQVLCALAVMCLIAFDLGMTKAQAALVSYDGTNVTWSVADLLTPLTTAVIAAVGAAVVIFTIWVGVRWIFRMVKGSK